MYNDILLSFEDRELRLEGFFTVIMILRITETSARSDMHASMRIARLADVIIDFI